MQAATGSVASGQGRKEEGACMEAGQHKQDNGPLGSPVANAMERATTRELFTVPIWLCSAHKQ